MKKRIIFLSIIGFSILLFDCSFAQKRLPLAKGNALPLSEKNNLKKNNKYLQKDTSPFTNFDKGTVTFKALFSGKLRNESDVDLIFAGINQLQFNTFGARMGTSIFIKNNMSVGVDLGYYQTNYTLIANIMQGFITRYIQSGTRGYSVNPFIKHYLPLNSKKNIYLTNQTELQYAFQIHTLETPINKKAGPNFPIPGVESPLQVLQRKFTATNTIGLGIRPGLLIFLNPHFAFETSINILGVQYKNEKIQYEYDINKMPDKEQIKNNVTNKSVLIDFTLNILKLGMGIAYYL